MSERNEASFDEDQVEIIPPLLSCAGLQYHVQLQTWAALQPACSAACTHVTDQDLVNNNFLGNYFEKIVRHNSGR